MTGRELSANHQSGIWVCASGTVDAYRLYDNRYLFLYSLEGTFRVMRFLNGVKTVLAPPTFSSAIKTGDQWNGLRVISKDAALLFYVNGQLGWSGNDSALSTGAIGLACYKHPSTGDGLLLVDWASLNMFTGSSSNGGNTSQ